jgi:hypothetical protein
MPPLQAIDKKVVKKNRASPRFKKLKCTMMEQAVRFCLNGQTTIRNTKSAKKVATGFWAIVKKLNETAIETFNG